MHRLAGGPVILHCVLVEAEQERGVASSSRRYSKRLVTIIERPRRVKNYGVVSCMRGGGGRRRRGKGGQRLYEQRVGCAPIERKGQSGNTRAGTVSYTCDRTEF
ncbi:hypothetical protein SLA2020_074240 [Shorea laevis]